jgi:cysteinyl-tRNA synthetase
VKEVAGAAGVLKSLGGMMGLFRVAAPGVAGSESAGVVDGLMKLVIKLRAEARKTKNFGMADAIRKGLTEMGITLEDRADGTVWRKD